jgi:hypothetical protein
MVDLIPAEFHRSLRMRRIVRGSGWTALGIAAALGAASAGLAYTINEERAAIARFKHTHAQARAQQARLTEVTARRDEARKQLQTLDGLRGGAVIGQLVDALETALIDGIWFQEVAYSRDTGPERKPEGAATAPGAAAKDGGAAAKADDTAVRIEQRAEIRGMARDHAALAQFIERLGARAGIGQVRLVDTNARSYPGVQVVDFHLALTLAAAAAGAQ